MIGTGDFRKKPENKLEVVPKALPSAVEAKKKTKAPKHSAIKARMEKETKLTDCVVHKVHDLKSGARGILNDGLKKVLFIYDRPEEDNVAFEVGGEYIIVSRSTLLKHLLKL
jgi:hypothetical protein